ncbi:unnamed protein product [Gongylonema pulchrum]|uniref:DRIM domain-containing protein n=1 Tax=Gongylonema pulchrum TaxID=637853 RepID=A0A183EPL9_9BILA|nr:unnamed protein product [Gongylonema pulchrum]
MRHYILRPGAISLGLKMSSLKLFYLLRLRIPLVGDERHSVLSIVCDMLESRSVNEVVKGNIIDGALSLLSLDDEQETPDLMLHEGIFAEIKRISVSEFVEDATIGSRFVSILLTFLESGAVRSDEAIQSLLLTVSRMLATVANSEQFLKNLVNMQSTLIGRSNREALAKVERTIALKVVESRKAELLNYVADLDSWDERRVGEPDHDKRYNAYTMLNRLNDMSLRSMATTNFRNVIGYFEKCNMDGCEKQDAVDSHLLHLVLKGLHNENEVC